MCIRDRFFNDIIVSDDDLVVPHPLMHDRSFVLKPLVELVPHFVHPLLNQTIEELYENLG